MNISKNLLPWHKSNWDVIIRQKRENQLPHAFLFAGMSGLGKRIFASQFSRFLLCSQPSENGIACGQCRHCLLIEAGNHPDRIIIEPESIGKSIKIDQIRELITRSNKTAQLANHKVIIIQPADVMNINAANALLKTLEEPTPSTIIILITEHFLSLPATIRSRCQIIPFRVPEVSVAKNWLSSHNIQNDQSTLLLHLAQGAPLKVLELNEGDELSFRKTLFDDWCQFLNANEVLLDVSKKWAKYDIFSVLNYLLSWVNDLICLNQASDFTDITNLDFSSELKSIALRYSIVDLYNSYDELIKSQRIISKHIALNSQLLIEGLLLGMRIEGQFNHAN